MRLDLGSGPVPHEGYTGVDYYVEDVDGVITYDLERFPWPWADGEVEAVHCSHFVEHLAPGMWVPFMNELWRVMKEGAEAVIVHPNLRSVRAFQDPTHRDFIPAERWAYADKQWRVSQGLDRPPYPTCDFEIVTFGYTGVHPEFASRSEAAQTMAATHYWDAVGDLMVTLRKR